jgi:Protein of unknown function (DUF3455)
MDTSCLFGSPNFSTIQTDVFNVWNACAQETNPLSATMTQRIQSQFNLTVDGQHYFANQNGTIEAVWDMRSGLFNGNPNAIVFAHKVQTANSPDGASNVAWVELKKDSGLLANTVYRLDTVQGQPPGSVSSSIDSGWWLSCSTNLIFFVVHPQQYSKC